MKLTKSMIYKPSAEARELYLFADNDGGIWESHIVPITKNLAKKFEKGIYSPEEAVKAYYYAMTEAAARYNREFGYSFSVTDRWTAAVDMETEKREYVAEIAGV